MTHDELRALIPEDDADYLIEKEVQFDAVRANDGVHIIFREFELPAAYAPRSVALRVILPSGYPGANPDMFWTKPWVKLTATQADPDRCSHNQAFAPDAEPWQRWSRHVGNGWRAGVDSLRTYMATVRSELSKGR